MAADRHAERFEGEPGDVYPGFDGLLADGFGQGHEISDSRIGSVLAFAKPDRRVPVSADIRHDKAVRACQFGQRFAQIAVTPVRAAMDYQ
jgi:hypothetical protein